ncbi:MAG: VTT domain-containing protein [Coriobacteriia bacterium]|nr:VTT domain-containing protein [Coriobacteriia bacterium]
MQTIAAVALIIGAQTLQIVTAVFPAAPIQVFAGLAYGPWWGTAICLTGVMLGNTIAFIAMRTGRTFVRRRFPQTVKPSKIRLLDPDRLDGLRYPELAVVAFSMIPFLPNGLVPYVFARTTMKLYRYLIAAFIGAVPAILVFTGLGAAIAGEHLKLVIGIVVFAVIVAIVAFLLRNRILDVLEKLSR